MKTRSKNLTGRIRFGILSARCAHEPARMTREQFQFLRACAYFNVITLGEYGTTKPYLVELSKIRKRAAK